MDVRDKDGNNYGAARVPIYIRIANYADAFTKKHSLSLREFIFDSFGEVDASKDALRLFLEQTLGNGNAIILLDGLDEIINQNDRAEVGRRIEQFMSGGNVTNLIIVTSRIAGYREAPLAGDLTLLTIRDLERRQVESFLRRWCPAAEKMQTPETLCQAKLIDEPKQKSMVF